jgi:hypothetical protein
MINEKEPTMTNKNEVALEAIDYLWKCADDEDCAAQRLKMRKRLQDIEIALQAQTINLDLYDELINSTAKLEMILEVVGEKCIEGQKIASQISFNNKALGRA